MFICGKECVGVCITVHAAMCKMCRNVYVCGGMCRCVQDCFLVCDVV